MRNSRPRAFVLVEAAAAILVVVLVAAVLCVIGAGSRRLGRLGDDLARLKQLGTAVAQYAGDNGDKFATFTWRTGSAPIDPSDPMGAGLFTATSDSNAAANQFVYLLRTRAGRPQFPSFASTPILVNIGYSHVVLSDYLGGRLPARAAVSVEDRNRSLWVNDPLGYDQGLYQPNLGTSPVPHQLWRHPYSASFRIPTCLFDASPVGTRCEPGGTTNNYLIYGTATFIPPSLTSIVFPSQKVMATDYIARHFGARLPWCTGNEARLPILMCDASVDLKAALNANSGCNPNNGAPVAMQYAPTAIDPPATGANGPFVFGRFLWTRGRLGGRDFGGPEVSGF